MPDIAGWAVSLFSPVRSLLAVRSFDRLEFGEIEFNNRSQGMANARHR
jgi:hypothetical protein